MSLHADLRLALRGVWLVTSIALLGAALMPLVSRSSVLYRLFPMCEARARGSSCALCGMTTAYVQIGRGHFKDAQASNQASVPLWIASLLNFPVAAAYSLPALLRARRNGEPHSL